MWVFGRRVDWVESPNLKHPPNSFHPVSPLSRSLTFSPAIIFAPLTTVSLLDAFFGGNESWQGRYSHQMTRKGVYRSFPQLRKPASFKFSVHRLIFRAQHQEIGNRAKDQLCQSGQSGRYLPTSLPTRNQPTCTRVATAISAGQSVISLNDFTYQLSPVDFSLPAIPPSF
jgi:hypothetical protein